MQTRQRSHIRTGTPVLPGPALFVAMCSLVRVGVSLKLGLQPKLKRMKMDEAVHHTCCWQRLFLD